MKVWILGAGGQLGCALIDACQSLKIPFIASKRTEMDITDLEQLKQKTDSIDCTHIINCAAFTDVDGAEKRANWAYEVNAKGPENLGIVARENGMQVVHVSTDYIFDGNKGSPYLEEDTPNPLGVYGKSKLEGEQRLLEELHSACIVRTSWVFGHEGKNFLSSILSLLQNKLHIQVTDDQQTCATYNRDLAGALLDLAFHSGVFHFANSEPLSRFQIVQDFFEEAQKRKLPMQCQKISPISSEAFAHGSPRPIYSVLSTKKVELVLGRKPRVWETVLSEYFDHVKSFF